MDKNTKRLATKRRLENKGLELFYKKGYYTTSIDDILQDLSLSKGAFYYHFDSKEDYFVQIIEDIVVNKVYSLLIEPIEGHEDAIKLLTNCFENAIERAIHNELDYGFLLNNFISEFNGRNENIMKHLHDILKTWEVALVSSILRGKYNGHVDRHVDAEAVAIYLMSSFLGFRTLMVEDSLEMRKYHFTTQLKQYIKSLEIKKQAETNASFN